MISIWYCDVNTFAWDPHRRKQLSSSETFPHTPTNIIALDKDVIYFFILLMYSTIADIIQVGTNAKK